MNDHEIERLLREMPAPELPAAWRGEILRAALQAARLEKPAPREWPPLLMWLQNLFARNPITTGALVAMWMLTFLFRISTPVDPMEKEMLAHIDRSKPVYLVSMAEEMRMVELLQDRTEPPARIP